MSVVLNSNVTNANKGSMKKTRNTLHTYAPNDKEINMSITAHSQGSSNVAGLVFGNSTKLNENTGRAKKHMFTNEFNRSSTTVAEAMGYISKAPQPKSYEKSHSIQQELYANSSLSFGEASGLSKTKPPKPNPRAGHPLDKRYKEMRIMTISEATGMNYDENKAKPEEIRRTGVGIGFSTEGCKSPKGTLVKERYDTTNVARALSFDRPAPLNNNYMS